MKRKHFKNSNLKYWQNVCYTIVNIEDLDYETQVSFYLFNIVFIRIHP